MKFEIFADYVFKNGRIITVNENDDIYEALAVKDNRIICVGDNKQADEYIGDRTRVIDLHGRAVTPGFIDSHIHFTELCLLAGGVIVSVKGVNSIEDIKQILAAEVKKRKPGEWIYLGGYDQNKLEEQRHPTYLDLDEVSPDNPVKCTRVCCHMSVFNSKAMELAGVGNHSVFERPDEVALDSCGNITGLFKEASQGLVFKGMELSREAYRHAFKAGSEVLPQYGITSIHDVGAGMTNTGRNMMQEEVEKGNLQLRIYAFYCSLDSREKGIEAINALLEIGPHTGIGNEWFKMGPAKLLLDGSTSGPSCYMKEPYCHDSQLKGIQNFPNQNELNESLLKAHREGFKLSGHAVGDAAVEQIVTAYEYINENEPAEDARFRIEHTGLTNPDLIERIKKLNAVVISNPAFITINGGDYNRFYGDRTEMMFAHKTYKENGIVEGFGSDFPVAPPNPLLSIYGAVTRKDIRKNVLCGESQKAELLDAIRSHTYNNAYASFDEKLKGSIEVGKLADLAVLSEDILSCDPEQIKDITVDITMLDGKIIFEK